MLQGRDSCIILKPVQMKIAEIEVMFRPFFGNFGAGYIIGAPGPVARRVMPRSMISEVGGHRGRIASWGRDA